jgi:hypothetical protein
VKAFFDFAGEHPILTVVLLAVLLEGLVDVVTALRR